MSLTSVYGFWKTLSSSLVFSVKCLIGLINIKEELQITWPGQRTSDKYMFYWPLNRREDVSKNRKAMKNGDSLKEVGGEKCQRRHGGFFFWLCERRKESSQNFFVVFIMMKWWWKISTFFVCTVISTGLETLSSDGPLLSIPTRQVVRLSDPHLNHCGNISDIDNDTAPAVK